MHAQGLTLIGRPAVLTARGTKNTSLFRDIKNGTWTPPIHAGRAALWPRHEVDALIAARIAGKTDDEMKALVQQLLQERKSMAERFPGKLAA